MAASYTAQTMFSENQSGSRITVKPAAKWVLGFHNDRMLGVLVGMTAMKIIPSFRDEHRRLHVIVPIRIQTFYSSSQENLGSSRQYWFSYPDSKMILMISRTRIEFFINWQTSLRRHKNTRTVDVSSAYCIMSKSRKIWKNGSSGALAKAALITKDALEIGADDRWLNLYCLEFGKYAL